MVVAQKIREFVENNLPGLQKETTVKDDDHIFDLGFVDSMFAVALVSFIEEEFEIELSDDELKISNFRSINSIVGFIDKKMNYHPS